MQNYIETYLDYCKFRKELDAKTIKAYRIDLTQYFSFVKDNYLEEEKNEEYITNLHKND